MRVARSVPIAVTPMPAVRNTFVCWRTMAAKFTRSWDGTACAAPPSPRTRNTSIALAATAVTMWS